MGLNQKANIRNTILTAMITLVLINFVYLFNPLRQVITANFNLRIITYLFKLIEVLAYILILNTSYYALLEHKRARMFLFVIIFTGFAYVEIIYSIYYILGIANVPDSRLLQVNVYYEVLYASFMVLFVITSIIDINLLIKQWYIKYLKIIPIVQIIASTLIFHYFIIGLEVGQSFLFVTKSAKFVQISSLLIIIFMYLKTYREVKNKYIRNFASGLIIVFLASIFGEFYRANEYNHVVELLFFVSGLLYLNHSVFRYNVGIPYKKLVEAQDQINFYTENLEKMVEERTSEITKVSDRLTKEIEYAKVIQQSILPPENYEFRNVKFVSGYIPCEKLSGDFYDIYLIDNDNIGMYILDVSGHGVPAALMTMFCNNYVKSSERLIKRYRGLKPHRNLQNFYEEFNKTNIPDEMHMVMMFASYNINTKILKYSNAGMNTLPIVIKKDGSVKRLNKNIGFPICKMMDVYLPEYESNEILLEEKDRVIFFTDGLTDENKNDIITEDELVEFFKKFKQEKLRTINKKMLRMIKKNKTKLEDDVTYFIMEIN